MSPLAPFRRALLSVLLLASSVAWGQVDLMPLFDAPTAQEIEAVRADWASRPTEATDFTHERIAEVDGFTVTRASFRYDGLLQVGLVRYPRHHSPDGSFPVLVLHHGGGTGLYYLNGVTFDETFPRGCLADSAFVIMPTYRGEGFSGGDLLGNPFSEGTPSIWDRDCDDAMAMLTAFLAATPEADPDRITSMGRSRGAGVAYHMALRDSRVRRSVILFGASQFRHGDILADCLDEVNLEIPATNPLSRQVMLNIVQPWLDGQKTLAEARHLLTEWSILPMLEGPLNMQIHHGELDENVPIRHAELVDTHMASEGAGLPEYAFFRYPLAGHNVGGMYGYEERVEDYLCDLPPLPVAGVPAPALVADLDAWPNPFGSEVRLQWDDPVKSGGPRLYEVRILDVRGRLIRRLQTTGTQPVFHWDGRDELGLEAPAGLYLVMGEGTPEAVDGKKYPGGEAGVFSPQVRGRVMKIR